MKKEKGHKSTNKKLLQVLSQLIEEHPDQRFCQILVNYGFLALNSNEYYKDNEQLLQDVMSFRVKSEQTRSRKV